MTTHPDTIADDATPTVADSPYRASDLKLPFVWENASGDTDPGDRGAVFRFPSADDPEPPVRRLLAMSLYASVLGLLGLAVAVRGLAGMMSGHTPGWYEPILVTAGLIGVALVVAAFLSIHRPRLSWLLLLAAAAPLTANLVATGYAL